MTFWFEEPNYVVEERTYTEKHPYIAIPYLLGISLAVLVGTTGNILIIGAIYVSEYLKTPGNVFLVNLAIADWHVAFIVNTFSIVGVTMGEAWFVKYPRLCEFVASLCLTGCYCSLLNIGAISFNRYIHICHYERYRRIFTMRNSVIASIGIWVASVIFEMPNFFGWGGHGWDKRLHFCAFNYKQSLSYTLFFVCIGIGIPWLLICLSYIQIYRHVTASKQRVLRALAHGIDKVTATKVSRYNQESMKLARTFFLLFLTYTICWTPFAFLSTLDFPGHMPDPVYIFFVLFAHGNSTINVFLYGLTNSHFRAGYVKFLRLHHVCGAGQSSSDTDENNKDILLRVKVATSEPRYQAMRNKVGSTELLSLSNAGVDN